MEHQETFAFIIFNLQILKLRLKNIQEIAQSPTENEMAKTQTTASVEPESVPHTGAWASRLPTLLGA